MIIAIIVALLQMKTLTEVRDTESEIKSRHHQIEKKQLCVDRLNREYDEKRKKLEEELGEATEILTLGGGWVEPIIALDGQPVGSDGLPGRVWRALDTAVRADFHNPDYTDLVPY